MRDGRARLVATQALQLASRDGAHGNPVADGRALELGERILAVEVEPGLLPVVVFSLNQRTTSHERAGGAPLSP